MVFRYDGLGEEMSHLEVYKKFSGMFMETVPHIEAWFPNGKDSIRVRIKSGSDFIFTYHNFDNWCYETVSSYINKNEGR